MQIAVVVNPTPGKRRGGDGERLGPLQMSAEAVRRALSMIAGQP
jgi:hypothetical protein